MKKAIFLLIASSLMVACKQDNTTKELTNDPIENLIAYLDENSTLDSNVKRYHGGQVFTTIFEYKICKPKGSPVKYKELDGKKIPWDLSKDVEVWDSTMSTLQTACSVARQCYHRESHARNRDTIYYALAMEAMEGERIQGMDFTAYYSNSIFHGVRFQAGRALTFQGMGDDEWYNAELEFITRSEGKPEQPFDPQFLVDDLNFLDKYVDGLKVYDVSYEYTEEDYQKAYDSDSPRTDILPIYDYYYGDTVFQPRVTGKLYVVPRKDAEKIGKWLKEHIMNSYVKAQPHTRFSVLFQEGRGWNTILKGKGAEWSTHLRAIVDEKSGCYVILFLEKTQGCYGIPSDWQHILRIKDHKAETISL